MSPADREAFLFFKEQQSPQFDQSPLPPEAIEIFWLRCERFWVDIRQPLYELYGDRPDYDEQIAQLFGQMVAAYTDRPTELRLLDLERQFTPDWFERSAMVGYVCYPERFAETLQGVKEKIPYLQELGITYLHLMPLLEPRPAPNDGGYAIMNYRKVRPDLGTMADLRELADALRARGIALCIDLVLNHTAQEHEWAQRAMAGEEKYLEYYFTFPDRTLPDAYERSLLEIFPDEAPGSFTWYPDMAGSGRWVWTTFMNFQWDLNYTNPNVFREMMDIMFFLVNQGVDVLRLDAVPFMWKRLGTNCQNQPEVFKLTQALRGLMKIVAPGVIYKAEAIVPPDQLQRYIGIKRTTSKQCELAYNNQLMVNLWSCLATHKATLISHVFHKRTPPIMIGSTYVTYVRNHDDIGWAMANEDLEEIGEEPFGHRQFLIQFYSGNYSGSFAKGNLFGYNPNTLDARNCGTMASLAGLEIALENNDQPGIDLAIRRILLLYSVVMFRGGIPLIYMGDEVGLLNDYSYLEDPLKVKDNRWIHRPIMDWEKAEKRKELDSIEERIYNGILHLVQTRKSSPLLHSFALKKPLWTDNEHVFALMRQRPENRIMILANFDDHWQPINSDLLGSVGLNGEVINLLTPKLSINYDGNLLYLAPYETLWLTNHDPDED